MKEWIIINLASALPCMGFGQPNLVRNPDFEEKNTCYLAIYEGIDTVWYDNASDYTKVPYWLSPNYVTPDYYNACQLDTLIRRYRTPTNQAGFQWPRSGEAYLGFIAYATTKGSPPTKKIREYIQSKLHQPLDSGALYCARFYCSVGYYDDFNTLSTDDLAMAITVAPPRNKNTAPYLDSNTDVSIQLSPQIINKGRFHTDTSAWYAVEGLFRASGGEEWITIGVFTDQGEADTVVLKPASQANLEHYAQAYYYIDDVSVVKVSDPIFTAREQSVCAFPHTLTAPAGFDTYRWSNGDTTRSTVVGAPGTYWVQVSLGACGMAADTVHVQLYNAPAVSAMPDTGLCLTALPYEAEAPAGFARYLWNTGDTTRSTLLEQPGSYTVEMSDGCVVYLDTLTLSVEAPLPSIDLGDTVRLCVDGRLEPAPLSAGVLLPNYRWSTGDTTAAIVVNQPGVYGLRSENACGAEQDEVVALGCPTRIYVPNAFTPERDGENSRFAAYAGNVAQMTLQVYDRWGNLVYAEQGDVLQGWDGQAMGKPAPSGVYTWVLRYRSYLLEQEEVMGGSVTLIR